MNRNLDNKEVEKYNKEQSQKMDMGDGWIRIDDSIETQLKDMSWLIEKYKDKNNTKNT